jgi:hypothetical protein
MRPARTHGSGVMILSAYRKVQPELEPESMSVMSTIWEGLGGVLEALLLFSFAV